MRIWLQLLYVCMMCFVVVGCAKPPEPPPNDVKTPTGINEDSLIPIQIR